MAGSGLATREVLDQTSRMLLATPAYPEGVLEQYRKDIQIWKDSFVGLTEHAPWLARNAAETSAAVGQMIGWTALAAISTLLGGPMGGSAVTLAAMGIAEGGDVYTEARGAGASVGQALLGAGFAGTLGAVLEKAQLAGVGRVFGVVKPKMRGWLPTKVGNMLMDIVDNGLQE